jgi:hypothetical protein
MRIWDIHCHPAEPRVPGRTFTEKLEKVIEVAGRMGIERMGLLVRADKDAKEIEQALIRHRDKVFGLLWMTLWNGRPEHHIDNLNRWIRDGPMVGMKLAGNDGVCSWPVYEPVFEHAARMQALIFIHAWLKVGGDPPLSGGLLEIHESRPQDVALLASRHPEMPLICGHSGGDWELGFPAVRAHKNVAVEVSGSWPTRGMVEMAVRELGAERVIFGSDIPGRSFASQLAKVHGAAISDREKQLIFADNLRRMAAAIFQRKGMSIGV